MTDALLHNTPVVRVRKGDTVQLRGVFAIDHETRKTTDTLRVLDVTRDGWMLRSEVVTLNGRAVPLDVAL